MFFVCFFDPSEVRDRKLIFMVHSASKRSMKCWHSLIAVSSLLFSQSWFFLALAHTVSCCAQAVRPVRGHLRQIEIRHWIHIALSLWQLQSSSIMLGKLSLPSPCSPCSPRPLNQCWTKLNLFLCVIILICPNKLGVFRKRANNRFLKIDIKRLKWSNNAVELFNLPNYFSPWL